MTLRLTSLVKTFTHYTLKHPLPNFGNIARYFCGVMKGARVLRGKIN